MKKNKTEKGITLVALIITIIILLILAVIAIGVVTGDGILFHAKDASTKYAEKAAEENSTLQSYGEILKEQVTKLKKVAVGTIAQKNSTINGEAPSAENPTIPAGFMAKNTETSKWDAEGGPEVDKGLVITDAQDPTVMTGNEFVWVPVTNKIEAYGLGTGGCREPDVVTGVTPSAEVDSTSGSEYDAVPDNLTQAGCTQDLNGDKIINVNDFKIQLTNEFNAMAASAKKYGGFYVGRYETSKDSKGKAQSVYGVESVYNSTQENNWYGLYKLQKEFTTSSVQGSMIWGSQHQAMIKWMGDAARVDIGDKYNQNRITGTALGDVVNNVYDLYGNSLEWTLEVNYASAREARGGNYYNSQKPVSGNGAYEPTRINKVLGSRLAIYIK